MRKHKGLKDRELLLGDTSRSRHGGKGRIMPLRSFEQWDFKERDLRSFELVLQALIEDTQKQLQRVEEQLKEVMSSK